MHISSHRFVAAALFLLAMALHADQAHAKGIDLRIGVKGTFTLTGLTAADAPPNETAPFFDSSLGAGGGGGIYGELHASKLLGVELDLLFESNRLFFSSTANDIDFDQEVSFEQMRVPLLAKLFLHTSDDFEFTAGLGPELILGLGASVSNEVTANRTTLSVANIRKALDYFYAADEQAGVAVAVELGCAINTLRFHIPIALRFAYNVLGKTGYADRVKTDEMQRISTFAAVETFQIGLVVGFGFLIPSRNPPPPPLKRGPRPDDPFAPFSGRL